MSVWRRVRSYIAHQDPLVVAANQIALVVAWNQPFYPLYLYWIAGEVSAASFLTILSTPFFLAVPALARRYSLAGRALLPLTGIANTVLCTKVLGTASGAELFLGPCLMVAALLFRRSERLVMLVLVGLSLAAYFGLDDRYGAPFHAYSADDYARFVSLNAISVAMLATFVGIVFSNALAAIDGDA